MRRREHFWCLYHTPEKNQLDDLRTDQVEAIFAAIPKSQHDQWLIWKDGFSEWKPFAEFPQLVVSLRQSPELKSSPPPLPKQGGRTAPKAGLDEEAGVDHDGDSDIDSTTETDFDADADNDSDSEDPIDFSSVGKKLPKSSTGFRPREVAVVDEPIPEDVSLALDPRRASDERERARYAKKFEVHIFIDDQVFKTSTVNISINGMRVEDPLPSKLPQYFNVQVRAKDHVIPLICSEVRSNNGSPSTILKIEANDHPEMLQTLLLTVG